MTARQALLLVLQGVHLHLPEPLECVPSVRAAQARWVCILDVCG